VELAEQVRSFLATPGLVLPPGVVSLASASTPGSLGADAGSAGNANGTAGICEDKESPGEGASMVNFASLPFTADVLEHLRSSLFCVDVTDAARR
jgi:hypothetical protein